MPNYTIGTSTGYNGTFTTAPNYNIGDGIMKINGDPASLEVKGKVVINGLDLEERLKTIEEVLGIPERNPNMEAKYPSLKQKYNEYIKDLSKYTMWERIKNTDDV